MASSSPKRWLKPPPQRTAYFCKARSPGVVLRVQQTRALVWAMRRTNSAAAVAMPERWPTKLSATRSAPSKARASPARVSRAVLGATVAPSRTCPLISTPGSSLRNAAAAIGRPAITPALRATMTAAPAPAAGGRPARAHELADPARRHRPARDHTRLARHHDGRAARAVGDRRDRRHVAGAAEVLFERARDRLVDRGRRQESVRAEQRHRIPPFGVEIP